MFKDRLKEARKSAGLSQEKLGAMLGISKQTISDYERGYSEPDMNKIMQLMKLLGVEANFLWQDEMAEPVPSAKPHSQAAMRLAALYDTLDESGKELLNVVADLQVKRMKGMPKSRHVPIIGTAYNDGRIETKVAATREQRELEEDAVETEVLT